jgi:hypothetical protein
MSPYIKAQIELQTEIADLANCHSVLRDRYLRNFSPELLTAIESVSKRIAIAEAALDSAIEAEELNEAAPEKLVLKSKTLRV